MDLIKVNRATTTVYIVTALMVSTAAIYFFAGSQDYVHIFQLVSSQNASNKDALADLVGTTNEMIFFIIVGVAYIPVALWTVSNRRHSKLPYVVAVIGSAALIVFYVATRTIALPDIGLQTNVGSIDIASKVLQSSIIACSLIVLRMTRRFVSITATNTR
jgi:hypothetical protein